MHPAVDALDQASAILDMPPNAIPTQALVIVQYLDPDDGDTYLAYADLGDATWLETVGLIEIAKDNLLERRRRETYD